MISSDQVQAIVFNANTASTLFAIRLSELIEALRIDTSAIEPVPLSSPTLVGFYDHRGVSLPLLNFQDILREKYGLEDVVPFEISEQRKVHVLYVRVHGRFVGLIVPQILGFLDLTMDTDKTGSQAGENVTSVSVGIAQPETIIGDTDEWKDKPVELLDLGLLFEADSSVESLPQDGEGSQKDTTGSSDDDLDDFDIDQYTLPE